MKKYEFTGKVKLWAGRTLRQIRAIVDFGDVKSGDIGGWIEKEDNLSHEGKAWVFGEALVFDKAQVCGEARVFGEAWVYGEARVFGEAWVSGEARVCDKAWVCGEAQVFRKTHWLCVGPIGSRFDFTTFFRTKDMEICVTCGCFKGNLEVFEKQVVQTHGESVYTKRYMAAIELAKVSIDLAPEASCDTGLPE